MNKKLVVTLFVFAAVGVLMYGYKIYSNHTGNQSEPTSILDQMYDRMTGQAESDGQVEIRSAKKPAIYLYPKEDKTDVQVKVSFDGEFTALDPEFNIPGGWQVQADKNGTIYLGDKKYPYLFWEGGEMNVPANMYSGFCVAGKDTKKFFEDILPKVGLNKAEADEFIAYWEPLMKNNPYNVISFQGKNYTDAVKMDINPSPDAVIRVFMIWTPSDKLVNIKEQALDPVPARTGFTVVEWGGAKIDNIFESKTKTAR